ncbi:MAG: hypothetical protein KAJ10_05245 [Thermodesulfovibrionia bacterium]|nr:hypothetical protein [Thermodesulfovibrionia bacterium]
MIETIISLGALGVSAGIGAGVWYKIGKMENKINFIYDNVTIAVDWKNGSKK